MSLPQDLQDVVDGSEDEKGINKCGSSSSPDVARGTAKVCMSVYVRARVRSRARVGVRALPWAQYQRL